MNKINVAKNQFLMHILVIIMHQLTTSGLFENNYEQTYCLQT